MSKHTPGPWWADGNQIKKDYRDTAHLIAETNNFGKENEANAQLIAAAPEMLNALRMILASLNGLVKVEMKEIAESAIKKAEGRK